MPFLPFLYIFNLVVHYETFWVVLNFKITDIKNRQNTKLKILVVANIYIDKFVNIKQNITNQINIYKDFSYDMIKKVSKGKYIDFYEF
jgi:hypothetical protein